MNNINAAKQEDRDLANAFVAFTHLIGLSKFFSYTPDLFNRHLWREEHKIDPRHKDH
jgi:hypothetical protein